nr:alcohol dehydrogenase catalytic domain-containing protein [Micromonospora sp. DSM 115978]
MNGFDLSVAAGYLAGMMEHRYPLVLGKDFAGTVAAVGDGVSRFSVGDAVFGVVTKPFLGDGGFGEYVTVPEQVGIAALPEGVDLTVAGALGLAGTAAVDALDAASPQTGETVLVSGATGGVGAIAVQYAEAVERRELAGGKAGGPGLKLRAAHALYDKLVYTRVRQALGGKVKYAISGGSPLGRRLALFYAGAGVTVFEGYGLTETTAAITVSPPDRPKFGT